MGSFSDLVAILAGAPALISLAVTALVILLTSDWQVSLAALLVQSLAVGLALTRFVRPEVALVKVLVGALVVLILYLSARHLSRPAEPQEEEEAAGPQFLWFRIGWLEGPLGLPLRVLVVLLVALAIIHLFARFQVPLVPREVAMVACWMGALGLAGLILSGDPLRSGVAFLTILGGFDLVYAGVEPSLALVGAFSAFSLLAALAFSYLTAVHGLAAGRFEPEDTEP